MIRERVVQWWTRTSTCSEILPVGFFCLSLLALSIYPGWLSKLLVIGIYLFIGLFPIGLIVLLVLAVQESRGRRRAVHWDPIHLRTLGAMVAATLILVTLGVPMRVAFLLSRSSFEKIATREWEPYSEVPWNRRVGIFFVDTIGVDEFGGVYFRVGISGHGPDIISEGFVYRNQTSHTPFGGALFMTCPLSGDWSTFSVSNDYP